MPFKEMNPEAIRALIADEEDVITPAVERDRVIYDNARCPVCGGVGADKATLPPKFDMVKDGLRVISSPFSPGRILAVGHARCRECGSEYQPESQVIISTPEPVLTAVQEQDPPQE